MKVVVFLGPPGVGKGTQCHLLSERLGIKQISTGMLIRQEINTKSDLGLRVKKIVESGNLVDDKTIFLCLERAFSVADLKHSDVVLLDGIPRNLPQAIELQQFLKKYLAKVDVVLSLSAQLEDLLRRFETRWTCSSCGQVESVSAGLEMSKYVCGKCRQLGTMYRRKDDELETVKKRFIVYQQETLSLNSYYEEMGLLSVVNALSPVEFVYAEIVSILLKNKI